MAALLSINGQAKSLLKSTSQYERADTIFIEGFLGERTKIKITILYGPYGMQGKKRKDFYNILGA